MYENHEADADRGTRRTFTHSHSLHSVNFTLIRFFLLKDQMLLLKSSPLWLLVAFLLQQQVSAAGAGAQLHRGRFSSSDKKMQCTWNARDAGDSVNLRVKCENSGTRLRGGITDLSCEYTGKPESCQEYRSNPKGFWKQVARALKKLQGRLCGDERALVRTGMCKRAPKDAHFKLDVNSSLFSSQPGEPETPTQLPSPSSTSAPPTACTSRADHRETAEELCSSGWASVCSFFLSMLQRDDC